MKEETTTATTTTATTIPIRNADDDYELIKVLMLGDYKTGKGSVLRRYHYNEFEFGVSSIGVDFVIRDYGIVNGKYYKIQIWDANSCERFRSITQSYYRGAHGFMLLYDCTNQESFNNLQFWINEIINKSPNSNNSTIVIIGNKCDLINDIKIDPIKSKLFCDSKSITSFQNVSAKDSININEPFEILFKQIIEKGHSQTISPKLIKQRYENNNNNKSCNIL
ncbi:hypothetical protein ACTFIR_004857 [Dictyostelium discoideum]